LKEFRVDRSLRMLNQVGIQFLSFTGQLPHLPLSPGQALAVTALNIYTVVLALQLSVILSVYLFFFFSVGYGVCYEVKRNNKRKLELWQQGCIVLGAVIRKVSFAMLYGLLFPKVISVLRSIHQHMLRIIDASFDTICGLFLPKLGSVLQNPATCLVLPYVLVGLFYFFNALVASRQRVEEGR
jgi:hypothetical protein